MSMKETIKEKFPLIDDETVAGLSDFFLKRLKETINVKIKGEELSKLSIYKNLAKLRLSNNPINTIEEIKVLVK